MYQLNFIQGKHSQVTAVLRLPKSARRWCVGWGGCRPVHRRLFSNIPGLHPLDASSTPQVVTTKKVSRHRKIVLGGEPLIQVHQLTIQPCEKWVVETINLLITSKFRRLWNVTLYFLGEIHIRHFFHYYESNLKLFLQFRGS